MQKAYPRRRITGKGQADNVSGWRLGTSFLILTFRCPVGSLPRVLYFLSCSKAFVINFHSCSGACLSLFLCFLPLSWILSSEQARDEAAVEANVPIQFSRILSHNSYPFIGQRKTGKQRNGHLSILVSVLKRGLWLPPWVEVERMRELEDKFIKQWWHWSLCHFLSDNLQKQFPLLIKTT